MKPVTLWSLAIGTLAVGGLGGEAASAKPPATSERVQLTAPPVGRVKLQNQTVELSVKSLAQGGAAHSLAPGVAVSADARVLKRDDEAAVAPCTDDLHRRDTQR